MKYSIYGVDKYGNTALLQKCNGYKLNEHGVEFWLVDTVAPSITEKIGFIAHRQITNISINEPTEKQ